MDRIKKENLDIILEWFNKSDLSSATVEYDDKGSFRVKISRSPLGVHQGRQEIASEHRASAVQLSSMPEEPQTNTSNLNPAKTPENQTTINAPIVGIFYRSSNPHMPPFAQIGDKIKKGQILCIIEAMKVMNELEAEFDMEIVSILVENANLVEYEQALFEVIPL